MRTVHIKLGVLKIDMVFTLRAGVMRRQVEYYFADGDISHKLKGKKVGL